MLIWSKYSWRLQVEALKACLSPIDGSTTQTRIMKTRAASMCFLVTGKKAVI